MTTSLQRFVGDDAVGLGCVGPVFLNVWHSVPTLPALQHLRAAQRLMPGPHVVITVVQEIPRGRLSDEARDLAEQIQADHLDRVRGHANVVEVKGFFAAAVRAIMTSGNLMKANAYPVKVFSDVDAAAVWLAPTIGRLDPVPGEVVKQAIDQLRAVPKT